MGSQKRKRFDIKKKNCFICEDCETKFTDNPIDTPSKSLFFSYGHDANRVIVDRLKSDLEKLAFPYGSIK